MAFDTIKKYTLLFDHKWNNLSNLIYCDLVYFRSSSLTAESWPANLVVLSWEVAGAMTVVSQVQVKRVTIVTKIQEPRAELKVENGLLKRSTSQYKSIVVPFNLLALIVKKVHEELSHIGRFKLIDIVCKNFWHPSVNQVCHDICTSCPHCQVFNINIFVIFNYTNAPGQKQLIG